jgi:hypothetical protein
VRVHREDKGFPGYAAIDGRPETGWAQVHGSAGTHTAVFRLAEPLRGDAQTRLILRLRHETRPQLAIGRFRIALSRFETLDTSPAGVPDSVLAALRKASDKQTTAEQQAVQAHYRTIAPELTEKRRHLERLEAERSLLLGAIPQTLVAEATEPRETRVLPRGNWMDDSGEVVLPGVPELFPQIQTTGRATRRDLAEWIVSARDPLAARVFVNRIWKLFFGVGLAKNLDDLGAQGEAPVHPELLDWLTVKFVESGWDMKQLVRLIVTSQTYRQSSRGRPDLATRDPYNRLYARQTPIRLDAEFVRDVALAASGLLSEKVGGPSVYPDQPRGYLAALNFPRREWAPDVGEARYRRGLYVHWQRTFLHPSLLAFDAATREECTAARAVSNTPMQALVLLNDPIFVEAARAFGERIVSQGGSSFEQRLQFAYRCALSRTPEATEIKLLRRMYHTRLARYSADRAAAARLVGEGETALANDPKRAELAAWISIARTILNLHETITRE